MYELIRMLLFSSVVSVSSGGTIVDGQIWCREDGISAINTGGHFLLSLRDYEKGNLEKHKVSRLVKEKYPENSMQVIVSSESGGEVVFHLTKGIAFSGNSVSLIFRTYQDLPIGQKYIRIKFSSLVGDVEGDLTWFNSGK